MNSEWRECRRFDPENDSSELSDSFHRTRALRRIEQMPLARGRQSFRAPWSSVLQDGGLDTRYFLLTFSRVSGWRRPQEQMALPHVARTPASEVAGLFRQLSLVGHLLRCPFAASPIELVAAL